MCCMRVQYSDHPHSSVNIDLRLNIALWVNVRT